MKRVTNFNNTWCEATEEHRNMINKMGLQITGIQIDGEIINLNRSTYSFGRITQGDRRQIKLIDNDFYYVDEEKEQNSFNKFGFETPEFEGEILKEINGYLVGYIINESDSVIPIRWTKEGFPNSDMSTRFYHLVPIKKKSLRDRIQDLSFDLNTIKWSGTDKGWDFACDKIRKELVLILEETKKNEFQN